MKKVFLICTVLFLSAASAAQQSLIDGKRIVARDSFKLGGVWRSTWPAGGGTGWNLSGNAATDETNNFIGTTDNKIFNFRTNNIARGLIQTDGRLFWNYNAFINGINIGRPFGETTNLAIGGVGSSAGWVSGTNTTIVGQGAALFNTTGSTLTALGANALRSNSTGSNNTAIGANAGRFNTTGSNQMFFGNLSRTNYLGDTSATPLVIFENATASLTRLRANGTLQINDGTQGAGKVFTSDANGVGSWQTPAGGVPALPLNRVGFGGVGDVMTSSDNFTWIDYYGEFDLKNNDNGLKIFHIEPSSFYAGNPGTSRYLFGNVDFNFQAGDVDGIAGGNKISIVPDENSAFYNNIAHNGKFGINKIVPTVPLDVLGNANITGVLQVLSDSNYLAYDPSGNFILQNNFGLVQIKSTTSSAFGDVDNGTSISVGGINGNNKITLYGTSEVNGKFKVDNGASMIETNYLANGTTAFGDLTGGSNGTTYKIIDNTQTHDFYGSVKFSLYGAGTLTSDASGNITAFSDERLKNKIKSYKAGLKELMQLKPIQYSWNEKSKLDQNGTYAGFSAQNVRDNIPLGTGENKDGLLSLQDRAIMATMVNAIQEQQKQIEDLKNEVKKLKSK